MKMGAWLFFVFCCAPASPQSDVTIGIFGQVTNAQTHEPIRRAFVKVFIGKQEWNEITDGEGRFRLPTLAKAEYKLVAHRDGFSDRAYKVELSDFDKQKELPIELFPQALITGRVTDTFGQGLESVQIQALGSRTRGGKIEALASATTNDLGEYRMSGLDPGTYQIRATYRDGRNSEFDPTPLTIATATYGGEKPAELALKAGTIVSGVDFILNPVRPATVRGTLRLEAGQSFKDYATLWILGLTGEGGHNAQARDGNFEIRDVGPGSYTISAATIDPAPPLFGVVTVPVRGADVDGIEITLRPSPRIQGHVRVEGDASKLRLRYVYFNRMDQIIGMGMNIGKPDKDGNFNLVLHPGEHTLSFDSIDNYTVQSLTFDDKPVTNWRVTVESSAEPKQFVLVLKPKP